MKIEFDPTNISAAQAAFIMNSLVQKFECLAWLFTDDDENITEHIDEVFLNDKNEIMFKGFDKK